MLSQGKLIAGILRDILEEIKGLEMRSHFQTAPDDPPDPGHGRLAVTMEDVITIKYKDVSETFVEVIDKLGRKRVRDLNGSKREASNVNV